MIDFKKLQTALKKEMGKLYKDAQWDGYKRITEKFFAKGLDDVRHLAYILATAYHETAATMKPVTEYGSQAYLKGKKYWPYIGRGYVQLTWDWNYAKYGIKNAPERALEPDLSAFIIVDGMEKGIFTGRKLSQYFTATGSDPVNARRIVNGTDKAEKIAGYYNQILKALVASKETDIFANDIGLVGIDQTIKYPEIKIISPSQVEIIEPSKTLSKGSGPRISRESCVAILKANGVDTSKVCLLGVRGYYLDSMGVKGKNDRGIYDDALIWVLPSGFMTFQANTDASRVRVGTGNGASKGMAMLDEGVHEYQMGIHNGSVPHPAFRQAAEVPVWRDGKDGKNERYVGWFGINIHRGGKNGTSSLGCQTVPPKDWDMFKELGYSELKKAGQKTFKYCLVSEVSLRGGKLKA